ncbi:hypothetical protein F3Y22_tig00110610pilonHSYRG00051 [Hibiscus syriacus]|uniref:Uncharacterized protein n=1 Tax=Hibiscus syriacus TaxID=106335 RepID=A0A6A3A0Y3_HIBSY|nr:hypothetical protein F3Y22_tig00110610pilonHSYRG00051 [Hibiscus syriacus]
MNRVLIRVLPLSIFLLFHVSNSENEEVKQSLVRFVDQLAAENVERDQSWGWNMTSDPCKDKWKGVSSAVAVHQQGEIGNCKRLTHLYLNGYKSIRSTS